MKANLPVNNRKRIVIIGGGFAGLSFIQTIPKSKYQVVLIDRHNYHQFQPLFYQVATAGLEPSSIVFPFRKILQKKLGLHFRLAEVERVDRENKEVHTSIGSLKYDYLLLSSGATTNFFGNEAIETNALPMKTISEALNIRNQILTAFENALTAETAEERTSYLNMIVVGGGPTGVEVAGTIAEMRRFILPKDYPELDFSEMKIELLEGSGRLLSGMRDLSSLKAKEYLEKLGVNIRLESIVTNYDGKNVTLKDGTTLHSRNLIWAAGVIANAMPGLDGELLGVGKRLVVNGTLQLENYPEVFALGDAGVTFSDSNFPNGHPQVAQVAIQQGRFIAKEFGKHESERFKKEFKYKDLGSMATVGRNKAVVDLPNRHFSGFFAWLIWMLVHLRSILGLKNKYLIFMDWLWNYFTYNLSLRLIIQPKFKSKSK
ncbi:MAG: NAD(P)/FAD-dependent oxidoreductase [Bacteroidetes bacterium]|nr:NAD(P)/FAD-dependent oxidoreductase [Bacteroidota bacterium]